jgi:hypothetical protein
MNLQEDLTSEQIETVLIDLMGNNLFGTSYESGMRCLKNENGEVRFSFKMIEGKTMLESLRLGLADLTDRVDDAFKTIGW